MLHTGHARIILSQAGSTNREAFGILDKRALEQGTLIITPDQRAGRGQGGTSWESQPGSNLTFSVILRPDFLEVSRQFMLSKIVALAVHEVIKDRVAPQAVFIKWPNDIYIGQGKVAGILIENRIMGSKFLVCVAGIGINVNQRVFCSDAPNPVSIGQVTQIHHDTEEILRHFCKTLDRRYLQLEKQEDATIDTDYLNAMLGMNQMRTFSSEGKTFKARITGVSEYGQLILQHESGNQQPYDMKQVKFLF